MYLFSYSLHGLCEDYLTCNIAYNAVMPLSHAPTRGRYSRIEGVTRTLIEMAWTMLDEYKTPRKFWPEAIDTACHVINRIIYTSF